jgi:hypothetical protein
MTAPVQQLLAERFSDGGAARLAHHYRLVALLSHRLGQGRH